LRLLWALRACRISWSNFAVVKSSDERRVGARGELNGSLNSSQCVDELGRGHKRASTSGSRVRDEPGLGAFFARTDAFLEARVALCAPHPQLAHSPIGERRNKVLEDQGRARGSFRLRRRHEAHLYHRTRNFFEKKNKILEPCLSLLHVSSSKARVKTLDVEEEE